MKNVRFPQLLRSSAIVLLGIGLWQCSSNEDRQGKDNLNAQCESVLENGRLANFGFQKCQKYLNGWLAQRDPVSGLIPRNLENDIDYWNAKDAAADNYPFMVLTSYFVDQNLFDGTMHQMLKQERSLTSRVNSLPDTYSFSKQDFLSEEVQMGHIIFGTSEYIKDGLLPLTEYLGPSQWSVRMIEMLYDLKSEMEIADDIKERGFGKAAREEVNGELLQILSRIYWMTGDQRFLDWAVTIGDYYLLGDHHPTRDLEYLRLRDHGCELISGLCELYVSTSFAMQEKHDQYKEPLYEMLDRILEVGRNEDGFFYDAINPISGEILEQRIADTWGYTLNGYYGVYLIDGHEPYKEPVHLIFSNLHKYRNHNWEGNADGYADAIESALNLYNRIPDEKAAAWIDSEIKVMWGMQQESGIIEGWHGDGNFARTTIMYNLWKSKGAYAQPWRDDLTLGAEIVEDKLVLCLKSKRPWRGKLYLDQSRHSVNMKLPLDWPRINQFPEWYAVSPDKNYDVTSSAAENPKRVVGSELINGYDVALDSELQIAIEIESK